MRLQAYNIHQRKGRSPLPLEAHCLLADLTNHSSPGETHPSQPPDHRKRLSKGLKIFTPAFPFTPTPPYPPKRDLKNPAGSRCCVLPASQPPTRLPEFHNECHRYCRYLCKKLTVWGKILVQTQIFFFS